MLFFDTYALIEIIRGNEDYKKYLKENLVTTKFNLMELYYFLLREKSEKDAEFYYNFYLSNCIFISNKIIKKAVRFKFNFKKLSYIDCIGYMLSLKWGIKFLTGDKEFKNLPSVEFVK